MDGSLASLSSKKFSQYCKVSVKNIRRTADEEDQKWMAKDGENWTRLRRHRHNDPSTGTI